ncbi:PIN domain-containing protein [Paracoccus sp. Z118]|uniref:PIN domain-containing protein n=1 Tax=Paracoccus sp. Z118 TaxID=2851017 RepID=UPI001C2BE9F1|nr:PIN domain-containing protein [Paracoccus sp. Z118]MBV0892974.1 PIN domain-containing protein [Paracoccus sp. Z118]
MRADFLDTNVILYLLDDGPKADRAAALLAQGGRISVQVLNETLANCIRKAGMSWREAGDFLGGVRELCEVIDLTAEIHRVGLALGERYGFSVYDAMIVSAALTSGCERLLSEDMQHDMLVEGRLRIVNPFRD